MGHDFKSKIANEEKWIDYLEGELEPSLAEDFERMLEGDEEAKKLVHDYQSVKAFMEKNEPVFEIENEDLFFDKMHDKIMADIKDTTPQKVINPGFGKKQVGYFLAAIFVGVLSLSAIMYVVKPNKNTNIDQVAQLDFKQMIKGAQIEDLSSVQDTVFSHESDMDFMMDRHEETVDEMSKEDFEKLMGQF